jgi:hypothetical protein
MNCVSSNNYSPNFNGFIKFTVINEISKNGTAVVKDLVLNTKNIIEIRPMGKPTSETQFSCGAKILTDYGKNFEIPTHVIKPDGNMVINKYYELISKLGEAERGGTPTYQANI